MKKVIALVLVFATICCSFIACAANNDTDKDNENQTTVNSGEVTDVVYESDNPKLDYENQTVKIMSRSNEWVKDEIWADAPNGETINDAVYSRNSQVEKELNVVIDNKREDGDNYAVTNKVRALKGTNDTSFDFFANSVYSTIMYTSEGSYADLKNCQYIEFDKPWWSQNFNDVASVGESQYFVTGSLALSMYRFIFVTFFNKELINNVLTDGTDLYDVVNEKKWTLAYQAELAAKIYEDTDGDGLKTEGDLYGFITNGNEIGVDAYWSSCELRIIDKTEDNWYEYVLDTERLTDAVDLILDLVYGNGSYSYKHETSDGEQITMRKKFAEKQAAMATLRLIEAESQELRENKDYGILPIPKFNKKQNQYYSFAHDQMTAFGIFSWLDEAQTQRAGAVLNAMGLYSIITVQPEYYEIALKSKYLNDEKSWDMLDLIVKSLYIDAGVLYTKEISSVHQELRRIIGSNNNSAAIQYNSNRKKYVDDLDILVQGIKAIQ